MLSRGSHIRRDVTDTRPLVRQPTVTHVPSPSSSTSRPASTEVVPIVDHGDRSRPLVALTFDSNLPTAMIGELRNHAVASFDNTAVLDELDEHNVPATFFLSGKWMEQYPQTTRRLANDPLFELGSHSYAHVGFAPHCYHLGTLPLSAMAADVEHSEDVLRRFTDHPTSFFRFPGGCTTRAAIAAVQPTGVTI